MNSLVRVWVNGASSGPYRACCEGVAGSAREDDDLETAGFLGKQRPRPVHAALITLKELVIEDNCCSVDQLDDIHVSKRKRPVHCANRKAGKDCCKDYQAVS